MAVMKRLLVTGGLLLVASLAVAGLCLYSTGILMPNVAVKDVCQPETLVIGRATGSPYTHGITIRGSGYIDGEATISLLLHGQPYQSAKLSGNVDFRWGGEWYSETAEIRYEPVNVRSGKVVLHYRFLQ
jgi:hypothetical protein